MLPGEGKVSTWVWEIGNVITKKVFQTVIISVNKDYFSDFKWLVQIVYLSQIIRVLNRINLSYEGECSIIHSTTTY